MILESSKNQLSRTYKSNLTQTLHPIFLFHFLKGSYLEHIKSIQKTADQEIQFLIGVSTENGYERQTLEKISNNYLNELQNPPVTNQDNSEDIKKVVKLP